jgi:uncharacterized protein
MAKKKEVKKTKSNAKKTFEKKDNTIPILTHILALFTWIIAPLIILIATKDEYAKKHAKRALNWQITYGIYLIISAILAIIIIGVLLAGVVMILNLVFCIIAAVKASNKELYSYPLTIKFLKEN